MGGTLAHQVRFATGSIGQTVRHSSSVLDRLKSSLRPAVMRISGLVGFLLVAAAFLGSLQDSLAAGG